MKNERKKTNKKPPESHLAVDLLTKKLDIRLLLILDILKKKKSQNYFCELKKNFANIKCCELLRTKSFI